MAGIEAPFGSEEDARNAYFGDESTTPSCPEGYVWDAEQQACVPEGTGPGPEEGEWGTIEASDNLDGGWVLAYQERTDGSQIRWFVLSAPDSGGLLFINSGGEVEEFAEESLPDEWPSFPTEDDARAAHAKWLEANPQAGREGAGTSGWSGWELVTEVPPWFIYVRTHTDGSEQYMIAGSRDGENVYLAPDAVIQSDPHIYDSVDAVDAALVAYYEAVEAGEIPADEQPTGQPPDESVFPDSPLDGGGGGGGAGGLLDTLTGNPLLVGGAAVAGLYLYSRGDDQ